MVQVLDLFCHVRLVSTVSYVERYQVCEAVLRQNYSGFAPTPWRRAAFADCVSCGGRTSQPSALLPLSHHGRRWVWSIWASFHHGLKNLTTTVPHFWVRIFWCTLLIEYYTITSYNSTNLILSLTLNHFSIYA